MKKAIRLVLGAGPVFMLMAGCGDGRDAATPPAGASPAVTASPGRYAQVDGLKMYYEVHGQDRGTPLVLLHGSLSGIKSDFGDLLAPLAKTRRVIAIEQQAHARTGDIDRPLRIEHMAGDTAGLLRQIGVKQADFFGYSTGGQIALELGMRQPDLVRKLVLASVTYRPDGLHPGLLQGLRALKPQALHGSTFHQDYQAVAPEPKNFDQLVEKNKDMQRNLPTLAAKEVRSVKAPALLMIGDSDIVRPEHSVDMFRLLGGGVNGDMAGLPKSQLAVLPGTSHISIVHRPELLLATIPAFLDAPVT
ncbi:alpha/beta hydrolase [Nonomuraea sp. NPDC050404]|uniref:alpha/beta fold hydrolase n=1 Tax=Nonomuraea sp. NPDC050404 TaxID=3155783 RepID=UPI00340E0A48